MLFNSLIEIQNQILGVAVGITGTPFSLHYSSDRVRGRYAAYSLNIPLSGKSVPEGLKGIKLEIFVAGQRFTKDFPPAPEQSYTFTWDGKDGSGRPVQGKQEAKIRIGYVYKAFYPRPEITRWQERTKAAGAWDASALGLNGWSLSAHHAYDRLGGVLYLGDGRRRNNVNSTIQTLNGSRQKHERDLGSEAADEIIIPAEDGSELYFFNNEGQHLRTIHALTGGFLYQLKYDAAGRLAEIEDGDGNITRIERDAEGRRTEIVAPYGQRTTLATNGDNSLASIATGAGEVVEFESLEDGLLTNLTDPRGNVSRFSYDDLGRLMSQEDRTGAVTGLASNRDDHGSLVALITPLGQEFTYLIERLPPGEERRVNKCCGGNEIVEIRGLDNTRTITYPDGMVIKLEEQADARVGIQVPLSKSVNIRTPGGLASTITMDRIAAFADRNNPLTLTSLTDTVKINGRGYTRLYNAATRTFTDTTPVGRQSKTTIDALGSVVRAEVAGLLPINLRYDKRGRLVSVAQGSGPDERSGTFSYDSEGHLETITDALHRTLKLSYDEAGRIITQSLPDGRRIGFTYDANGNVISITPPGRPPHIFTYTTADLNAAYTPPDVGNGSNETLYVYNKDEQLNLIKRPNGQIEVGYDSAGRQNTLDFSRGRIIRGYDVKTGNLISIAAPGGISLSYAYDGSLVTKTTWSGVIAGTVSRTYDTNFRVTSFTVNGNTTINFKYDDESRLTQAGSLILTRSAHNGLLTRTTLGGLTDELSYNAFGEMTRCSGSFGSTALYDVRYATDKLGRIAEKTEAVCGQSETFTYNYDQAGRLFEVKKNGATTAIYTHDSNGNRLSGPIASVTYAYDAEDRLLVLTSKLGTQRYAYSANGELLTKTAGNKTTSYQYDELGNLTQVEMPDGTQIEYIIDGQNRRIGKKIKGSLVQAFLYQNGLNPIAELDSNNKLVSLFIYGSRFNVPDYMVKSEATYRIIADHIGSPRLVVDVATGDVAQRIDYDEFGNITLDTNPGFQPFGFAGGLYDQHTKLTRFGARDYDAETGRWTARDPILFGGGQVNLYAYLAGDPIRFIDPAGLQGSRPSFRISGDVSGPEGKYVMATFITQGFTKLPGRWYDGTKSVEEFRAREAKLGEAGQLDLPGRQLAARIRDSLNHPAQSVVSIDIQQDGDQLTGTFYGPNGTERLRFNLADSGGYTLDDFIQRAIEAAAEASGMPYDAPSNPNVQLDVSGRILSRRPVCPE